MHMQNGSSDVYSLSLKYPSYNISWETLRWATAKKLGHRMQLRKGTVPPLVLTPWSPTRAGWRGRTALGGQDASGLGRLLQIQSLGKIFKQWKTLQLNGNLVIQLMESSTRLLIGTEGEPKNNMISRDSLSMSSVSISISVSESDSEVYPLVKMLRLGCCSGS